MMYKSPFLKFKEDLAILDAYYKDLFNPELNSHFKILALDYLANFAHQDSHKKKLENLYQNETDPQVRRLYEKIFTGNYESIFKESARKQQEFEAEINDSQVEQKDSKQKPDNKQSTSHLQILKAIYGGGTQI